MNKLERRLQRLEKALHRFRQHAKSIRYDDEDWLLRFEQCAHDFADRPDFPEALAAYRRTLLEAARDPLFEPPADFQPQLSLRERRLQWRQQHPFPKVWAAWDRVVEAISDQSP